MQPPGLSSVSWTTEHPPRNSAVCADFAGSPARFGLGPVSSLYDFVTFGVMLWILQAGPELFHAGWFIESLVSQTLVIFVIRTAGRYDD
jgi:hypothetical protein